mmetsp:Transcript_111364/g.314401  ORF Transcript_111364/g.314401 Transcript_111364/m.314401 type:complete len:255 (-) Transcript_111364:658-1422(-)
MESHGAGLHHRLVMQLLLRHHLHRLILYLLLVLHLLHGLLRQHLHRLVLHMLRVERLILRLLRLLEHHLRLAAVGTSGRPREVWLDALPAKVGSYRVGLLEVFGALRGHPLIQSRLCHCVVRARGHDGRRLHRVLHRRLERLLLHLMVLLLLLLRGRRAREVWFDASCSQVVPDLVRRREVFETLRRNPLVESYLGCLVVYPRGLMLWHYVLLDHGLGLRHGCDLGDLLLLVIRRSRSVWLDALSTELVADCVR